MTTDADVVLGAAGDSHGSTRERRGAALFDLILVQLALSGLAALVGIDGAIVITWTGPALVAVLATSEWLTGSSPGKLVTGLRATNVDGSSIGPHQALVRRPWALPVLLSPLLPDGSIVIGLSFLAICIAMLVTTDRAADGRGFHDRLARTTVRPADHPAVVRRAVIVVTIVLALVSLIADFTRSTPAIA